MKTPLYAVACAGICAAGIVSYTKISSHQAELDATDKAKDSIIVVENAFDSTQKEYDVAKADDKAALDALNETKADVELTESKKLTLKRTATDLDNQIASQDEKIEEVEKLIVKVKDAFQGQDVELAEIPAYVEKLNTELKDLKKYGEEPALVLAEMEGKLETSNSQLTELNKREVSRISSLRQNSISSLITAVNSNWGFVVIKPHPEAVITEDTQLIIVRGAQHLGRLNISAVEANRVIADVDYDSLVAGSRVRAGDRVILAKANSH